MKIALLILAALLILSTVTSILRDEAWWIRVFDFPRSQITFIMITALLAYLFFWQGKGINDGIIFAILALCTVYQAVAIYPYTQASPKQTLAADSEEPNHSIKLLIANVLVTNRNAEALIDLIRMHQPDVVAAVEVNAWWDDALSELSVDFPYSIGQVLENGYGMKLFSKFELLRPRIRHLIEDSIPSIHTFVKLRNGIRVDLRCLHPRPPSPTEADSSTERDAELLVVAKEVKDSRYPVIVVGDLNDVAWSRTTQLFQKISRLLDPRIGRGFYSTFPAGLPLLRWPLDHAFHSEHFKLVELQRMPNIGSDHFPILVALSFEPDAAYQQDAPEADPSDLQEADEKIEKAHAKVRLEKQQATPEPENPL